MADLGTTYEEMMEQEAKDYQWLFEGLEGDEENVTVRHCGTCGEFEGSPYASERCDFVE